MSETALSSVSRDPMRVEANARIACTVLARLTLLDTPGGSIGWFGGNILGAAARVRGNPPPPPPPLGNPPRSIPEAFCVKSFQVGQSFPAPGSSILSAGESPPSGSPANVGSARTSIPMGNSVPTAKMSSPFMGHAPHSPPGQGAELGSGGRVVVAAPPVIVAPEGSKLAL